MIKPIHEIVKEVAGKSRLLQNIILKEYVESIIDECAEIAEMWKSETPEFTKGYIETVKHQL